MTHQIFLAVLGFLIGMTGTMIGAGGGFLLMPILLLLYPSTNPGEITAISLSVVCLNAWSGSIAYAFKKRIHFRSALYFSLAGAPGAILGAVLTGKVSRRTFEIIFAVVLMSLSVYLWRKSSAVKKAPANESNEISYNLTVGLAISFFVGIISSFMGIGGGILHVPAMIHILAFPVHLATATAHFILAITATIGVVEKWVRGDFAELTSILWLLGPTVIIGAQVGAQLSSRVSAHLIVRVLSVCLFIASAKFLFF